MKVYVFMPSLRGGGAEKVISELVNKWGVSCACTLYLINKDGVFTDNLNVEIVELKSKRIYTAIFEFFLHCKKNMPDIIFTSLIYPISFLILTKIFLPNSVKYVCRLPNIPSIEIKSVRSKLVSWLYRKSISFYDLVICQSKDMLLDLMNFQPNFKKVIKINNPAFYQSHDISLQIKDRYILVGRLTEQKNIKEAIKAAHLANVKLDIYGEGELKNELSCLINELNCASNVKLKGFSKEIQYEISHSKALILTSKYEGFPNVLLEAISSGVPVIVKNAPGGINEIVNDGNGIIYDGDEKVLASILSNFESSRFCGEQMSADIKEKYSPNKIAAEYLLSFERLLS